VGVRVRVTVSYLSRSENHSALLVRVMPASEKAMFILAAPEGKGERLG
jgi:hypothetical protein